MNLIMHLSPSGSAIVNEFDLEGGVDNQFVCMSNGCGCPKVPDLGLLSYEPECDDEWDIVGAKIGKIQNIAVKFKRDYFELKPLVPKQQCESSVNIKPTKSEEKLNVVVLGLMEQMHQIVTKQPEINNNPNEIKEITHYNDP